MKYTLFLSILLALGFCTQNTTKVLLNLQEHAVSNAEVEKLVSANNCKDKENYQTSLDYPDHTPTRYVRVNFHFIDNKAGTSNFDEAFGTKFAKKLVKECNERLRNNKPMKLPKNQDNVALPINVQYVLTGEEGNPKDDGIYFHKHDSLAYFNKNQKSRDYWLFSPAQYDNFGIRKKEVINVFMLEHHPDSIASKTYNPTANGVGTSKWAKVAGAYYYYRKQFKKHNNNLDDIDLGVFVGHTNHEIGHSLGLAHTWATNDGCDDTPKNNNCWNYVEGSSRCNWGQLSNNVMDYNAFQNAYSPCQIGKIHYNMSKRSAAQHKMLKRTWCQFDPKKSINIKDDVVWGSMKDLEGNITIENGASLTIQCMVSMAPGSKIIVKPRGKLIIDGGLLYNDCGKEWEGVEQWRKRKHLGKIEFLNDGKIANVANMLEDMKSKGDQRRRN